MSIQKQYSGRLKFLAGYYGILQSLHLIMLTRAGLIFLLSGNIPYPALPPAAGWSSQELPYLFGMGGMDAGAACLGIFAAFYFIKNDRFVARYWVLSLGIALTSAIIFTVGTFPSGAWHDHPLAYGSLVIFFSPLFLLFVDVFSFLKKNE
jgi:hypothetical protein